MRMRRLVSNELWQVMFIREQFWHGSPPRQRTFLFRHVKQPARSSVSKDRDKMEGNLAMIKWKQAQHGQGKTTDHEMYASEVGPLEGIPRRLPMFHPTWRKLGGLGKLGEDVGRGGTTHFNPLFPCSSWHLPPLPRHPPSSATIVSCMAPPSVHTQPYIHMGTHRSHGVSHTAIKTQSIVKNSVLRLRRTANGNTVRAGPHETFG